MDQEPPRQKASKPLLGIGFSGSGVSDTRSYYSSLPGTESEIKFLQSTFEGDYFLGTDGSKSKFLEKAKEYDILHLAVHGEANSISRYQSSLIFNGFDSLLKTSDLYAANLNARLAILSACESGIGQINKGEGTFSIARGFALVGVPSTVMSLWKVNDRIASELMVQFHSQLNEGTAVDVAISQVKREYLINSDQYTSHPYYWSAFVSLGQEIHFSESDSYSLMIITVGIALAILLLIFLKLKKRKET